MNPLNKYLIITKCQTLYKVGYNCEKRQSPCLLLLPVCLIIIHYSACLTSPGNHIPLKGKNVSRGFERLILKPETSKRGL